jgi:hypothetical protein
VLLGICTEDSTVLEDLSRSTCDRELLIIRRSENGLPLRAQSRRSLDESRHFRLKLKETRAPATACSASAPTARIGGIVDHLFINVVEEIVTQRV